MGTVAETNRILDSVLGKLDKLNKFRSVLGNLVSKVNNLKSKVKVLEVSSEEFKHSITSVSNKVDELEHFCRGVEDLRRSRDGTENKLTDLRWR